MEQLASEKESKDKSVVELKKELELLEKKAKEYLAGWQRAKADYLNLKKENEKKQGEIIRFANLALLLQLLPIIDHLKIACQHIPQEQQNLNWVKGFVHIKDQFIGFFKKLGIEEIKTLGQKFDPSLHEAVAQEKKAGFKTDIIFEEIKPGYTLYGKVIQPAKVKVTK